jgi:ribosome-associated translation inhibitor RaiA/cold shock CspA family protein
MQIPLEITYLDVEKTDALETLIREKVAKLEQVCNYMNSCRVGIEKTHDRPKSGSPYRVRIDITVPPSHEIAAVKNPGEGNQYDPLEAVIRSAFDAARRQLVKLTEKQRDEVKSHPEQELGAIVTKLFPEQEYGFIRAVDSDEEIYFHRNSVINNDFDRIEVGTGVRYVAQQDEQGLMHASTVQIVDKPGANLSNIDEEVIERPLGWK